MSEIKITLSKTKITLICLGSILFVAIGFAMFGVLNKGNSIFLKLIGISSILFFGATGVSSFLRLFDQKPGLIINDNGIIDNSSGVSIGLIEWKDMTKIRVTQVQSTKFILIDLIDANKYIHQTSGLKKKMIVGNNKVYGTPISISSNGLQCNFEALEKMIRSAFEKHTKK